MAIVKAFDILESIQRRRGQIDIAAISNMAVASLADHGSLYFELIVLVIILCWLFSMIDAYRMGKRLGKIYNSPRIFANSRRSFFSPPFRLVGISITV